MSDSREPPKPQSDLDETKCVQNGMMSEITFRASLCALPGGWGLVVKMNDNKRLGPPRAEAVRDARCGRRGRGGGRGRSLWLPVVQ